MAARGTTAKQNVIQKIKEIFGEDYIGESGGKQYVWANDGGEKVQIALSLTCPKTPIGEVSVNTDGGLNFEAETITAPTKFEPAEITEEEQQNLREMMKRLGL